VTSRSKEEPSKPWPPRWALIYFLILGVGIVYGGLVALHGYRQWSVVVFYAVAAVGILAGSISHRLGGQGSPSAS
jgi:hypothetical protein